ncbi:g2911 [Coccomyxa elongata]
MLSSEYAPNTSSSPGWWTWLTLRVPLLGSPQLLQRIALTVVFLALARVGQFIPVPGVDFAAVAKAAAGAAGGHLAGGLEDALGAESATMGIFQLGIGPYIDASWTLSLIFLLKIPPEVYSHLQSLRRSGREGGAVIKMYTQIGSLLFAVVLGAKRAFELRPHATVASGFLTNTMVTLVAGAMLLRFVCDQNEDYGLGDGISLLICAGMAAGYAAKLRQLPGLLAAAAVPAWKVAAASTACLALAYTAVYVTQIEKRLPLVYYKRRAQGQEAGKRARPSVLPAKPPRTSDYLPLRITPSGMGPLLMASFVFYMLPQVVAFVHPPTALAMASFLFNPNVLPWSFGLFVFLTMLLDFGSGNAAREMAEWMASVDAGVKGVSPGPFTEDFLVQQQGLMRFWGGLAVAGLAVAANLFDAACARHLGASLNAISLIMITGFITTALRQAQSLMQLPRLARALARERELLSTA